MPGHDLRSPLNAISLGLASLAEAPGLTKHEQAMVARTLGSVRRLDHMVGDILDFARGRLGAPMPIELRPTDLSALIREIADEVQSGNPGLLVDLHTSGDLDGKWDAERLKQAVSNLLINAIQHGSRKRVGLTAKGDKELLLLEAHNEGPAIPEELLANILDPPVHGPTLKSNRAGLGRQARDILSSVNIGLLTDADLKGFLERAWDRIARLREREIDELISDEQIERMNRGVLTEMLQRDLGVWLKYEEV
jgi:K+-sensing histidine kinase KdpD